MTTDLIRSAGFWPLLLLLALVLVVTLLRLAALPLAAAALALDTAADLAARPLTLTAGHGHTGETTR